MILNRGGVVGGRVSRFKLEGNTSPEKRANLPENAKPDGWKL